MTIIDYEIPDKHVWFDNKYHPGTKHFRRIIRYVVEDFEDEEYSKEVFEEVMKELEDRLFYIGQGNGIQEVEDLNILIEMVGQTFEEEQEKRTVDMTKKSKSLRKMSTDANFSDEEVDYSHKSKRSTSKRKDNTMRSKAKSKGSKQSFSRSKSSSKKSHRSKANSKGSKPSFSRSKSSSKKSHRKGGYEDESDIDMNIYIDNEKQPGTKQLREAVRRTAANHPDAQFSKKIFQQIIKGMNTRQFFWSLETMDEMTKRDVVETTEDLWDAEIYLLGARPQDVYFSVSSHPGTRAWVRSVQQVVIKHGDSEYTSKIYKEIKKRLYDSKFYVGLPPECEEATKRERVEIFDYRYQTEKDVYSRINRKNTARAVAKVREKVASGLLKPKHVSDTCEDNDSTAESSMEAGEICRNPSVRVRAIPGDLYWLKLSQRVIHVASRIINSIAASFIVVRISAVIQKYLPKSCMNTRRRWKVFCKKDVSTGKDVFNRLERNITISMFGWSSPVPMLVLLGFLCIGLVTLLFHSLLSAIVLPLV